MQCPCTRPTPSPPSCSSETCGHLPKAWPTFLDSGDPRGFYHQPISKIFRDTQKNLKAYPLAFFGVKKIFSQIVTPFSGIEDLPKILDFCKRSCLGKPLTDELLSPQCSPNEILMKLKIILTFWPASLTPTSLLSKNFIKKSSMKLSTRLQNMSLVMLQDGVFMVPFWLLTTYNILYLCPLSLCPQSTRGNILT